MHLLLAIQEKKKNQVKEHQPKQQRGNLRVKKEATRTCVEEYEESNIDEVFTGSNNEFSDEEYIVKFVKERKVE